MAYRNLDLLDKKILNLVADNARMPFLEVARICNVSGAAIHQRIAKMTKMGLIKGSKYVIDPEKLGYETCAYVGLYLKDPATFDDVVEKLRMIPEVTECHYTTGGYDMFIKLYARTNHDLLNIIHDRLQPLGLSRSRHHRLNPSPPKGNPVWTAVPPYPNVPLSMTESGTFV